MAAILTTTVLTILATIYVIGFALMAYWARHARHADEDPIDEGKG